MRSKWYELKNKAILLRKKGFSLGKIAMNLKIPKSTLSGWFKNVKISNKFKKVLLKNWKQGLINARKNALVWHSQQKYQRIQDAKIIAANIASKINLEDKNIQELALAMLYLGEGNKVNSFGIGNSDPRILNFFLKTIYNVYNVDKQFIHCSLNLRLDQNKDEIIKYWSKILNLPISCFKSVSFDKRTKGIASYSSYKGVCQIRFGSIAIQRRLLFLAKQYCDSVINNMGD